MLQGKINGLRSALSHKLWMTAAIGAAHRAFVGISRASTDLRRAKDLCAMDCGDEDVNGWPARLHLALNVDEP